MSIIDFDPSIESFDPFIEAANEMVTEMCAPAGYSDRRLRIIEQWLAAHFLAIRDPRYVSEGIGAANASYYAQPGLNLALTPYGQQAMLLDTKGGLAYIDKHVAMGKRPTVGIICLKSDEAFQRTWYNYPWRFFALWTGD